ncbi:MAG TPA: uracil phosphoribosyltransferase [Epsilonproteobacteria bacterium]|nr:uracil phosphoribosyltransferase [Campylobacterota bacterium]
MIREVNHPVVTTLTNRLRKSETDASVFRHTVQEITRFLVYEALSEVSLTTQLIETWQGEQQFGFIEEGALVFVSILRAGLPMTESVSALFPNAQFGFLAMKRDEKTHHSVTYYDRIPEVKGKTVILLDPMIATGGSLCDAVSLVKSKGPKAIISLNLIGSPEGLEVVEKKHPDISLCIARIDERLDENMFIYPGLGDAGDRSYNTVVQA